MIPPTEPSPDPLTAWRTLEARQVSPHTKRAYQRVWVWLRAKALTEGKAMERLDEESAARWWQELATGKKPSTQVQLKAAINFWYQANRLVNPFAGNRPARFSICDVAVRYLQPGDVGKVLQALERAGERSFAAAQTYVVAYLLFVTASRFAEVTSTRLGDLVQQGGGRVVAWRTRLKGGRAAEKQLPARAGELLAGFLKLRAAVVARTALRNKFGVDRLRGDHVFSSLRGGALPNETFNRHLREACRAAGVEVISAHGLRHSAATIALRHEKRSLREVQELLGHQSIQTTVRYTHLGDEVKLEIASGLEKWAQAHAPGRESG